MPPCYCSIHSSSPAFLNPYTTGWYVLKFHTDNSTDDLVIVCATILLIFMNLHSHRCKTNRPQACCYGRLGSTCVQLSHLNSTVGRLSHLHNATAQKCALSGGCVMRMRQPPNSAIQMRTVRKCCPTARNDMPEGGWFYTCDSENVNFKGKIKAYAPP